MYFDFYSVNDWINTYPMSVKTVYKLYTLPDYDINHRIIESNKYILFYTLDGEGSIQVDGQEFTVQSNSLIFANATKSLAYQCSGEQWNFWLFEFKTEPFLLTPNYIYHTPFKMNYFDLCDQILLSLKEDRQQLASAYFYLFYSVLASTLQCDGSSFNMSVINKSLEYMKENIMNFSVQSLSQYLNVPIRTLFYIFNKEVGTSPNRYFQGIKTELGKEYLESTNLSISEISQHLGYCSSSHFSTVFKQFVGVRPAQYRREFELRNLG